jgi:hypothetical protein
MTISICQAYDVFLKNTIIQISTCDPPLKVGFIAA